MSYDLNFWKYKKGIYLNNQEVYELCSDGELVEGLETLPVHLVTEEIRKEFSEWDYTIGSDTWEWENPNGKGAFQLFCTSQFARFDCYGMFAEDLNRIIDVMLKFDCPLYDPQVSKRFDDIS